MTKIKYGIGKKIFVLLYCIAYFFVSRITGIGCIWNYLFHIQCPGCGFTRAVTAALQFDFETAFYYHPMFWSFPLLVLYFLFNGDLFTNKKVNTFVIGTVLSGFLITWLIRLFVSFV